MCCGMWVPACVCTCEVHVCAQCVHRVSGEGKEGLLCNTYHAAPHTCHTHACACSCMCSVRSPLSANVRGPRGPRVARGVSIRSEASGPELCAAGQSEKQILHNQCPLYLSPGWSLINLSATAWGEELTWGSRKLRRRAFEAWARGPPPQELGELQAEGSRPLREDFLLLAG